MDMTFNYSRGAEWVWVIGGAGHCSMKKVWAHDRPSASAISLVGGASIDLELAANIDTSYSRRAIEGNGKAVITYTFKNEICPVTGSEQYTTSQERLVRYPKYSGFYDVSANVSDGEYSTNVNLGKIFYSGGINCPALELE